MQFITHSPEETELLGQRLGETLSGGEIIAYQGGLGAGKTAFTRGLARGLGISMRVTSPTYTIVNEYTGGRLPLFHFDMYRLGSAEELFEAAENGTLEEIYQRLDAETLNAKPGVKKKLTEGRESAFSPSTCAPSGATPPWTSILRRR